MTTFAPVKLPTQLAPRKNLRRLTEEEKIALLVKAREEIDNGQIAYATRLVDEVIEAIRR